MLVKFVFRKISRIRKRNLLVPTLQNIDPTMKAAANVKKNLERL